MGPQKTLVELNKKWVYWALPPPTPTRDTGTITLDPTFGSFYIIRELVSLVGKLLICISLMGRRFEPKTPFLFWLDARSQPNVTAPTLLLPVSLLSLSFVVCSIVLVSVCSLSFHGLFLYICSARR